MRVARAAKRGDAIKAVFSRQFIENEHIPQPSLLNSSRTRAAMTEWQL
jgi:hypothetical protein